MPPVKRDALRFSVQVFVFNLLPNNFICRTFNGGSHLPKCAVSHPRFHFRVIYQGSCDIYKYI